MEIAARVAVAVEVGRRGLVDLAEGELDQAVDDGALVREVEVERGPADERAAGDRVDRDALVGLLAERRRGRASRIEASVSLRDACGVDAAIAEAYAAANARQAFWPPKPNELDSASSTPGASRAPSAR